jgi:hypothetical protein
MLPSSEFAVHPGKAFPEHAGAGRHLAELEADLNREQIAEAKRLASEWHEQHRKDAQ